MTFNWVECWCLAALSFLQTIIIVHSHNPNYHGGEKPSGFHDTKVVRDTEHINEHLDGVANASDMSPEELEFHYFKLHDYDNNTQLDGLEIYKALTHLLPYAELQEEARKKVDAVGKTPEQVKNELKDIEVKYYTDIVDNVLEEDDMDSDGYLTYAEYVMARRREEVRDAAEKRRTAGH